MEPNPNTQPLPKQPQRQALPTDAPLQPAAAEPKTPPAPLPQREPYRDDFPSIPPLPIG